MTLQKQSKSTLHKVAVSLREAGCRKRINNGCFVGNKLVALYKSFARCLRILKHAILYTYANVVSSFSELFIKIKHGKEAARGELVGWNLSLANFYSFHDPRSGFIVTHTHRSSV